MLKLYKDLRKMTLDEKWGVVWACIAYIDSQLADRYEKAFMAAPGKVFQQDIMRVLTTEGHIPESLYALLSVVTDSIGREEYRNGKIGSETAFWQAQTGQSNIFMSCFIY